MFFSSEFMFDDIRNKDMGVILVSLEKDILLQHSLLYKVNPIIDISQKSIEGYLYGVENSSPETIDLTLALVDNAGNPRAWTIKERNKIFSWMVQDDFKPFISEDDNEVIYYLKCIGVKKEFNSNLQGLVTFTMQPSSPYAYTPIVEHKYYNTIGKTNGITIDNISNIDKYYYPSIHIYNYDNTGKIEIINNNTQQKFTLENLEIGEEIIVDMQMKHIFSSIGHNRLKDSNMNWIGLIKGNNNISFNGEAEFNIKCQFPMLV